MEQEKKQKKKNKKEEGQDISYHQKKQTLT